nr:MAG TPA: hypothetical protein [Caudoviricetes sp.]
MLSDPTHIRIAELFKNLRKIQKVGSSSKSVYKNNICK